MLRLALRTSTSRRFAAAAAAGAALAAVATPKAQARASKAPLRTRTEEASPAATAAPAAAAAAAPLTVTLARDGEALPPDVVASWDQRYEASFRDTGWLCFRVLQTVLTTAVPVGSLITLAYDGGVGAAAYGMIAVWAMARDKYWHEMLPGPLMERQGSPLPDRAVAEEHQVTLNGQTEGMAIVGIQVCVRCLPLTMPVLQ